MKKKIFLTLVMSVIFALTFVLMVSAATTTHAGKEIDIDTTVTLDNGTVCNLFDKDGNALTWYLDANDELKSIRTDDQQMWWHTESWNEVTNVGITFEDGTTVNKNKFVVVNMMDDDVVKNAGAESCFGNPVTNFKHVFNGCPNLEYLYLRLDTTGFFQTAFTGASKLKYVNIAELTLLAESRGGQQFSGCTSLFAGQILDLSNTKLKEFQGGGIFAKVPISGLILPTTFIPSRFSEWAFQENPTTSFVYPDVLTSVYAYSFKNCANLEIVYLNGSIESVGKDAFLNCSKLEKVFFVGTKAQLETMLANTDATGNNYFLALAGEDNKNIISYAEYQKLQDKSGKYFIYDYSYCEAYNNGNHTVVGENPCVGTCSVCQMAIVKHSADAELTVSYVYANFAQNGQKITSCANDGCTYEVSEEIDALFTCLGYSASEGTMGGGIALGFKVNSEAIAAYTEATGKTIAYGVFAVSQSKLGTNNIFGENGEMTEGVLGSEIKTSHTVFEIKITGIPEDKADVKLALGAYVAVTDGEATEYSYMQPGTPAENEKYCFVSYNDVVGAPATGEAE